MQEADSSIQYLLSKFDANIFVKDLQRLSIDNPIFGDILYLIDFEKVPTHHILNQYFL